MQLFSNIFLEILKRVQWDHQSLKKAPFDAIFYQIFTKNQKLQNHQKLINFIKTTEKKLSTELSHIK